MRVGGLEGPEFGALRERYEVLKRPYFEKMEALELVRQQVLNESSLLSVLQWVELHRGWGVIGGVACGSGAGLWLKHSVGGVISGSIAGVVAQVGLWWTMGKMRERYVLRVLRKAGAILAPFELEADHSLKMIGTLESSFAKEYDSLCVTCKSYPPDWRARRETVVARDGYRCTNCGWPEGFRARRRELHVHHVKSLADGGDNGLDNLITLCHMCHRAVDSRHHGVKKLGRRRRH